MTLNGYTYHFRLGRCRSLEMDGKDGCTLVQIDFMPPNYAFENSENAKFCEQSSHKTMLERVEDPDVTGDMFSYEVRN